MGITIPPRPKFIDKPVCHHNTIKEEIVVETIVDKYKPISGSRIDAINNFYVEKKRNIEKKIWVCDNCGENFNEKPIIDEQRKIIDVVVNEAIADYTSGYNNIAIGHQAVSTGSTATVFGVSSGVGGGLVNTDRDVNILNKNNMDLDMGSWFDDENQKELRRIKELLKKQKNDLQNSYKYSQFEVKDAISGARQQLEEAKRQIDELKSRKKKYGEGRSYEQKTTRVYAPDGEVIQKNKNPKIKRPLTVYDFLTFMFSYSNTQINTVDGVEYYDVEFYEPLKMDNPKLSMFENGGEVLKWEKHSKGLFKGSEQRIKIMRIETIILDEWYQNKLKNDDKKIED